MPQTRLDSWRRFFYLPEELMQEGHTRRIKPKGISRSRDARHFQDLMASVFSSHVIDKPCRQRIKDLNPSEPESISFYKKHEIDNAFLTEFYITPALCRMNDHAPDVCDFTVPSDDSIGEVISSIAEPGRICLLIGDVGEGKSVFLSKLALELRASSEGQSYFPVIIDVQNFCDSHEEIDDPDEFHTPFWEHVCDRIAGYAFSELNVRMGTTSSYVETRTSGVEFDPLRILDFLGIRVHVAEGSTESLSSDIDYGFFGRLERFAKALKTERNTRLVLIFDNLDTFYYHHERFMLFKKGFKKLTCKTQLLRSLVHTVSSRLGESEISFVFTARPYVCANVFIPEVVQKGDNRVSGIYRIEAPTASVPMAQRVEMLKALGARLKNERSLPDGKRDAIKKNIDEFEKCVADVGARKNEPLNKLFALANQAFRSMVKFYEDLPYDPRMFARYFSHDVIYLYMLGMRELFEQMVPEYWNLKRVGYFPNVFLVDCDNEFNEEYEEASRAHKFTYWLKFIILTLVDYHSKQPRGITIRDLLDTLEMYDEHVVRLAIGSLATSNEFNCLQLHFGGGLKSLRSIEKTTRVGLTVRGAQLLGGYFCLGLECLQLYFDDWLLARPRVELLHPGSQMTGALLDPMGKSWGHSYEYLLDAEGYSERRKEIVPKKAKQALILLHVLWSGRKYEIREYGSAWDAVRRVVGEKESTLYREKGRCLLFDEEDGLKWLSQRIVDDAVASMHAKDAPAHRDLLAFADELDEKDFDSFFEHLLM